MSLLSDALILPAVKSSRKAYSSEEVELAIAYFKGDVTEVQIASVLKIDKTLVSGRMRQALVIGVRNGAVVMK